jgi:hypothetical protein
MSVFSSLRYCIQDNPHNYTNLYWALGFVPLGLFFDFMDGKVARWRKKASLMGQELDSLADLVRPVIHKHRNTTTNTHTHRSPSASDPPPQHSPSASAPPSTTCS